MVSILSGYNFLMDPERRQEFTEARPHAGSLQGPNEAAPVHVIVRLT